jgi:hypothetical protein
VTRAGLLWFESAAEAPVLPKITRPNPSRIMLKENLKKLEEVIMVNKIELNWVNLVN